MSWLVTAKQYIPAVIGEEFGGGYFAGYISHTADGNPTHALIVAPRETGATGSGYTLTTNLAWASNTTTNGVNYSTTTIGANASKDYDGMSVMSQVVALGDIANFPAFQFCKNLSIGGYTDWYLPSLYELEIAYFNLKPTTAANVITNGPNSYAVPPRNQQYTLGYPLGTPIALFAGGSESFAASFHWAATEGSSASSAFYLNYANGLATSSGNAKSRTDVIQLRAFRRIAL